MGETSESTRDERQRDPERRDDETGIEEPVERIAASTLRVILLILGVLLLLYATGQAIGVPMLGTISEALDTDQARWMVVAFFGLVLLVVSLRGFRSSR